MHESEPDKQFTESEQIKAAIAATEARERALESTLLSTGPSEIEMLTVTLLMRNYDVMITLLEHFDKEAAEQLWAKHNEGEHFNPAIFLPVLSE